MSKPLNKFNALAAVRMMTQSDEDDSDENPAEDVTDTINEYINVSNEAAGQAPTHLKSILKRKIPDGSDNDAKSSIDTDTVVEDKKPPNKQIKQEHGPSFSGRSLAQTLQIIKENEPAEAVTSEKSSTDNDTAETNQEKVGPENVPQQQVEVPSTSSSVDHKSTGEIFSTANSDSTNTEPLKNSACESNSTATKGKTDNLSQDALCTKPSELAPSGSEVKPPTPKSNSEIEMPKSKYPRVVVKISGLPFDIKSKDFLTFLGVWPRHGAEGIKLICDSAGDPSGYAYVELERHADKMLLLKMTGMKFKHRTINVVLSSVNAMELEWMSTQRILKQIEKSPFVRIGDLPFKMRKQDIIELLSGYHRQLEDVYCGTSKRGCFNSGFAFVVMDTKEMAEELCNSGINFPHKKLLIKKIHPEVVSRWCRRNQQKLIVRDSVKYDMAVDVPVPNLEPQDVDDVEELPFSGPKEENINFVPSKFPIKKGPITPKTKTSRGLDVQSINADPNSNVFFYDEDRPDLIIPIEPKKMKPKEIVNETNQDPRSAVFVYDNDTEKHEDKPEEKEKAPKNDSENEPNSAVFICSDDDDNDEDSKKSEKKMKPARRLSGVERRRRNKLNQMKRKAFNETDQKQLPLPPGEDSNIPSDMGGPRLRLPTRFPGPMESGPMTGDRMRFRPPIGPGMGPQMHPFGPHMRPMRPGIGPIGPRLPPTGPYMRPGIPGPPRGHMGPLPPVHMGPGGRARLPVHMSHGGPVRPPMQPGNMGDPQMAYGPGFMASRFLRMFSVPEQANTDDIKDFFAPILPAKIAQNVGYDIYDIDFYTPGDAAMGLQRHGMMIRKNVIKLQMLPGPAVPLPPRPPKKKNKSTPHGETPPLPKHKPTPPTPNHKEQLEWGRKTFEKPSIMYDVKNREKKKSKPIEPIIVEPFPEDPFQYHIKPYDPKKPEGQCVIQPMEGFFCTLCRKFYKHKSAGFVTHCKSKVHYDSMKNHLDGLKEKKLQKEKELKRVPEETTEEYYYNSKKDPY